MTRDEAKKIVEQRCGDRVFAARFVDVSDALGMLKLDEAPSVVARAFDVMHPIVGGTYATRVLEDLDFAGLKIVEKD